MHVFLICAKSSAGGVIIPLPIIMFVYEPLLWPYIKNPFLKRYQPPLNRVKTPKPNLPEHLIHQPRC